MNPQILDDAVQTAIKALSKVAELGSAAEGMATRYLRALLADGGNSTSPGAVQAHRNLVHLVGLGEADTAILAGRNEIKRKTQKSA